CVVAVVVILRAVQETPAATAEAGRVALTAIRIVHAYEPRTRRNQAEPFFGRELAPIAPRHGVPPAMDARQGARASDFPDDEKRRLIEIRPGDGGRSHTWRIAPAATTRL